MRMMLDMQHDLLSSADRHVLLALRVRAGDNGKCWPTQKRICRDTGLSERTVRGCTAKLERLGLIKAAKSDYGRQKVYEITTFGGHSPPDRAVPPVSDLQFNTGNSRQETGADRRRIPAAAADRMNQRNEKEGSATSAHSPSAESAAARPDERTCHPAQIGELIRLLGKRRG
jgi:hypothetical protein